MTQIEKVAKTVNVGKISDFVMQSRIVADKLEAIQLDYPLEDQPTEVAKVFLTHGLV